MKNINLEWYKTFVTFAQADNINEAARTLNLSQPAVSLHLKNLEAQFDLPLFQMIGRKKELTVFGKELFSQVEETFKDLERKVEHLKLMHSNVNESVLRIGGRREIIERILMKMNSTLHLKAIDTDTESALKKLKTLDLDVALTHSRPDSADLIAKSLFKEKAKLIVHPKLIKKGVNAVFDSDFLKSTPVFFYKTDPPFIKELYQHNKIDLKKIKPQVIVDNWNVIISMVEKGSGYAVVPSSFPVADCILSFDLPKKIDKVIEIYAVFHTSSRKSSGVMEFIKQDFS